MQATTRKRTLTIGAIALLAATLAFAAGVFDATRSAAGVPSALVKRGDVRITLTETGELRAEHQATIQATNDKMIVWMVPEGTFVHEGDLVVQLDSSKYVIQRSAADSGLEMAKAQLEAARSDLEQQGNAERQAKLEYEKLPELAEKGFINQNEVATARLAYEKVLSARRSYEAAVVAAKANVERAAQEVGQSQLKYDLGAIKAPREGLVVYARVGDEGSNRKIEVGMTPFEGQELMYLPDLSSMIVETEISEVDIARVQPGSSAEVRLDAYADVSFRGEVASISGLARRKISKVTGKPTGLKVFDVTIKVLDQDERLRPGLSVTTEILVSDYRDSLYVPVSAIFLDELDHTIAYVRKSTGIDSVPIELAGSSDRVAIVSEGLEEGDEVLLEIPQPS